MCDEEDYGTNGNSDRSVEGYFGVFPGRRLGTWAVWAKRDPVRCLQPVSISNLHQLISNFQRQKVGVESCRSRVYPAFLRQLLIPYSP